MFKHLFWTQIEKEGFLEKVETLTIRQKYLKKFSLIPLSL